MADKEITCEILKKLGALNQDEWAKELNLISWNGYDPMYDLRKWASNGVQRSKGIALSVDEAIVLRDILNSLKLDGIEED